MYDIEGKYKNLMMIAEGKCIKLHKKDNQIKYRYVASRFWDAKVIIENCSEEERRMLHRWILCKKESAEQEKTVFDLINTALLALTLVVYACNLVIEGMKMTLQSGNALLLFSCFMIPSAIYILIYTSRCIHRSKTLKCVNFLLNLFEE